MTITEFSETKSKALTVLLELAENKTENSTARFLAAQEIMRTMPEQMISSSPDASPSPTDVDAQ